MESLLMFKRLIEFLSGSRSNQVFKEGKAMRVMFFYPGEEGTYIEGIYVKVFTNGIVHIEANQEEVTTHIQNCEILWCHPYTSQLQPVPGPGLDQRNEDRSNNVRLLRLRTEQNPPEPPLKD